MDSVTNGSGGTVHYGQNERVSIRICGLNLKVIRDREPCVGQFLSNEFRRTIVVSKQRNFEIKFLRCRSTATIVRDYIYLVRTGFPNKPIDETCTWVDLDINRLRKLS